MTWEQVKTRSKDCERRSLVGKLGSQDIRYKKRNGGSKESKGAPSKRMKFGLIREDWGEQPKVNPEEQEQQEPLVGSTNPIKEQTLTSKDGE